MCRNVQFFYVVVFCFLHSLSLSLSFSHSLTHSLTHLLTHSFIHSFTHFLSLLDTRAKIVLSRENFVNELHFAKESSRSQRIVGGYIAGNIINSRVRFEKSANLCRVSHVQHTGHKVYIGRTVDFVSLIFLFVDDSSPAYGFHCSLFFHRQPCLQPPYTLSNGVCVYHHYFVAKHFNVGQLDREWLLINFQR